MVDIVLVALKGEGGGLAAAVGEAVALIEAAGAVVVDFDGDAAAGEVPGFGGEGAGVSQEGAADAAAAGFGQDVHAVDEGFGLIVEAAHAEAVHADEAGAGPGAEEEFAAAGGGAEEAGLVVGEGAGEFPVRVGAEGGGGFAEGAVAQAHQLGGMAGEDGTHGGLRILHGDRIL